MSSINHVTISGNIGGEPQQRSTQNGSIVLQFNVAVNERIKDPSGQWTDRANWGTRVMFGNRANATAQYLHKGTKVAISGKLRESRWQTQDGQNRSRLEIIVDEIEFMQPKQQDSYQQQYQQPQPYQQPQMQPQPTPSLYDSNIPF